MCLDIVLWGPSMKGGPYPPGLLVGMKSTKVDGSR